MKFKEAEEKVDVERMHNIWCIASVETLKAVTETEGLMKYKHAEKRTQVANMCGKKSAMPYKQRRRPDHQ